MKTLLSLIWLLLGSLPVIADETRRMTWGSINPSIAILTVFNPTKANLVAELFITNRLSTGGNTQEKFEFELEGNKAQLYAYPASDKNPDTHFVKVPNGYYAIPDVLILEEDESGTILIYKHLCC